MTAEIIAVIDQQYHRWMEQLIYTCNTPISFAALSFFLESLNIFYVHTSKFTKFQTPVLWL